MICRCRSNPDRKTIQDDENTNLYPWSGDATAGPDLGADQPDPRRRAGGGDLLGFSTVEEVGGNVRSTGYPDERLHLVKGPIEDTIPEAAPGEIALLRLDTDTYSSARHEMERLFPRLAIGGVMLVDDYGSHPGSKKAVDEYFESRARFSC